MLYQVMIRRHETGSWEAFQSPTEDPFSAMRLIQLANSVHAEVTVLQGDSAPALDELVAGLRRGEIPGTSGSPFPGLTSTPRVHIEDAPLEHRRWEIEQGPGGDHDQPYRFTLPQNSEILAIWLRLLRRWQEAHGNGDAAA